MTISAAAAEAAIETIHVASADRERQRVTHLVLGADRPPPVRAGRGRSKRKVAVVLAPGIEERVQLRERWSHKIASGAHPETLEHAARKREGALARLYATGAIDAEQLASAVQIAEIVHAIGADVAVRTASLETRVDTTRRGDGSFHEQLGRVRREMAYTRWRNAVQAAAPALLELIVDDVGIAAIALRHRMHKRRIKQLLADALDLWPRILGAVCGEVDPATLAAAHAGILG